MKPTRPKPSTSLTQLEALAAAGVAVCVDGVFLGEYQITVYPNGKRDLHDHSHFTGPDLRALIAEAYGRYAKPRETSPSSNG